MGTPLDDGDFLGDREFPDATGILQEDLAFDTFMNAPPWGEVERIVRDRRTHEKAPAEGENFEWIAKRARTW